MSQLLTALNDSIVEVTQAVAERRRVEQVNRDINHRVASLEQANCILDQSNRSNEANAEDFLEQAQHASLFPVGSVRRTVEAQVTSIADAIEKVAQPAEVLVATIERVREMNLGEGLAARS